MIVTKLQEALEEIASQRQALDKTESQLKAMIADLNQDVEKAVSAPSKEAVPHRQRSAKEENGRYDDIVEILRAEGRPLHIKILVDRLGKARGEALTKEQIEPGMNRHIKTVKKPRICKTAPSTYGLPEWQDTQARFPQTT